MMALGRELAARGHDVTLQTWQRWSEEVEAEGMRFAAAPEYHVFPTEARPLKPYQPVVRAAHQTLPQLEYPRRWPPGVHVVGPLAWELPSEDVELPPGDAPLVLVAPSTVHDKEFALVRATLAALADEPVRVIAAWNRRPPPTDVQIDVPANARLVPWLSYRRVMPSCDVVVGHAGHGTMVRALESGCVVVACPAAGDMGENAARVDWAGVGVRLPRRFVKPGPLRLAIRRALGDPRMRARAGELAAWAAGNDS